MSRNARRYKKRRYRDESAEKQVGKRAKSKPAVRTKGCLACSAMLRMGNTSEPIVCAALQALCVGDPQLIKNVKIVKYFHVRPNSQLDTEKIDFLVLLSNKLSIWLQIKSAPRGEKEHLSKEPYISCFMESGSHTLADVSSRLKDFLIEVVAQANA